MEVVCCFPQSHPPETPEKQNYHSSIDFDSTVNPPDERVRCKETDSAHQEAVDDTSEACVRKEEHGICEASDVELGGEIIARVGKDPESRGAA
jgi:hypothetical protein